MEKLGIMICGHGSRSKTAEQEFGLLARGLKQRFPETPVEDGFLEYSAPNIHMGLDELRNAGVNHIVAVPGMLFAATHAKNDIPSVLTTYQKKYQHLNGKPKAFKVISRRFSYHGSTAMAVSLGRASYSDPMGPEMIGAIYCPNFDSYRSPIPGNPDVEEISKYQIKYLNQ